MPLLPFKFMRKLQSHSGGGYHIQVPKKWVESLELEKGQKMVWEFNPKAPMHLKLRKATHNGK